MYDKFKVLFRLENFEFDLFVLNILIFKMIEKGIMGRVWYVVLINF